MTPPVTASVVVPTVGRLDLLERCLRSVLACDPPAADVVVVDQSGSSEVAALVERLDTTVRRVPCDGRGTARAMNVGLAAVRHDTVLVSHDDCTVEPDWVGRGAALAAAFPGAILTGRVLPPEGSAYVPSTKTDPRPHDYTGTVTSGVLYPANMVASRSALEELGGFDERPGLLVAEDNDLCYRWLAAGRPFRYEPELVVWHHDWRTPAQLVRTHVAYARGQGAFYAKHLHAGDRRVVAMLRWDLRHGLRSKGLGLVRRTPRWQDPYREMVWSLLRGLAAGWFEARRLDDAAPPAPVRAGS
jgi:GT2 family glycosyltransferase